MYGKVSRRFLLLANYADFFITYGRMAAPGDLRPVFLFFFHKNFMVSGKPGSVVS